MSPPDLARPPTGAPSTLLAIGDEKDFDSFRRFCKQRRDFRSGNVCFRAASYSSLLDGDLPPVEAGKLIVLFFFPFVYWERHIEPKNYKGVYGNRAFQTKFMSFWKEAEKAVRGAYRAKKITYVNHPGRLAAVRDKERIKRAASQAGVPVPRGFATRKVKDIVGMLDAGHALYVKVRYGSGGKGITYLEKDRWMTNFRFSRGRILSRKSDYGWTFVNVTGNRAFLGELLRKDVVVEEAVDPLLIQGRKFDLRMYVYGNRVLYVYGRTNGADAITTNISQGARGEEKSFAKLLPQKQLKAAERQAVKAVRALGLGFAGADMMLCSDRKTSMLLEVNAFPGFPKARRYNLSRFLIAEIIKEHAR